MNLLNFWWQISFTGSGPTGSKIMTAAAQLVKVCSDVNK